MKKTFTILLMSLFGMGVFAQCPLTEAIDFTATDVHGTEWNLFDVLDGGQYVCIDFFFTTCGPCQQTTPKVSEAFTYFGCNTADVIFLGIDTGDSDEDVLQYEETYGALYPSISGIEGGGTQICNDYQIPAYPTVILIAPDRSIVEQDIWPIPTAQTIIDALESHGIEENACIFPGLEEVNAGISIQAYPNPARNVINISLNNPEKRDVEVALFDVLGRKHLSINGNLIGEKMQMDVSTLQAGNYCLNVISEGNRVYTKPLVVLD